MGGRGSTFRHISIKNTWEYDKYGNPEYTFKPEHELLNKFADELKRAIRTDNHGKKRVSEAYIEYSPTYNKVLRMRDEMNKEYNKYIQENKRGRGDVVDYMTVVNIEKIKALSDRAHRLISEYLKLSGQNGKYNMEFHDNWRK